MTFAESDDAGERFGAALDEARRMLRPPETADPAWPAVAAAALFAICAMIFATTAILTPAPKLAVPPPVIEAAQPVAAQAAPVASELRGPT